MHRPLIYGGHYGFLTDLADTIRSSRISQA
jgi:hypothetical protein